MNKITVTSADHPRKVTRRTTVFIPKDSTLMDLYTAIQSAEGCGYKLQTTTTLVYLQDGDE